MPAPLPEEVREEVKRRLADGETGTEIAKDMDEVSESTAYRIQDELEREVEEREEIEGDVFRGGPDVTVDDFEQAFRDIGVGIKAGGELKAKVSRALSAIEMDGATEDPYHARDILYDESGLEWEWANRIIRRVFDQPGFPYQQPSGGGQNRPAGYGYRNGGGDQPSGYGHRRPPQESGPPPRGGGYAPEPEHPPWVNDLHEQMEKQNEALEAVAAAIQQGGDGGGGRSSTEMIEVHTRGEDGEDRVVRVPADSPRVSELMGTQQDDGLLEKLAMAKEAGLIVTPDQLDSGESEVAEAVQAGLEQVGRAQQESSSNFRQAIEEVTRAVTEQSDSDDLTAEKVDEIIEDRLTKSEQDRLREEIHQLREEVTRQSDQPFIMAGDSGTPLSKDPEVMKRYVDKQAESDQLKTVQHAGDKVIDQAVPEIRRGLRDIGLMIASGQPWPQDRAEAGGGPAPGFYTPPEEREDEEPTVESLEPEDVAPETEESDDVAELWDSLTAGEA